MHPHPEAQPPDEDPNPLVLLLAHERLMAQRVDPQPQPLNHTGPPDVAPEPTSGLPPWWALVGLGVLGAGAGLVAKWKETYYPSGSK